MTTPLRLEVFQNGELLREMAWDGQPLLVGRGEDCGVRLDDRAVSRKHGLFRSTRNGVEFEKKSKFGEARVDGREVDQVLLKEGECLAIASYEIRFVRSGGIKVAEELAPPVETPPVSLAEQELPPVENHFLNEAGSGGEGPSEPPEPFGIEMPSEEPVAPLNLEGQPSPEAAPEAFDFATEEPEAGTRKIDVARAGVKPILEFKDSQGEGSVYEIVDQEISIGRSSNCHVILEDKKSSRKHVVIQFKDGSHILRDLGSSNGTLVNGNRVDQVVLSSGDEIRIGDTRFIFKLVQSDYEAKKSEFLHVPDLPAPVLGDPFPQTPPAPTPMGSPIPFSIPVPEPIQDFSAPTEDRRGLFDKLRDRFNSSTPIMKIVWAVVALGGVWAIMEDDAPKVRPSIQQPGQAKAKGKDEKKKIVRSIEMLTLAEQAYVEAQYKIAFDHYKNREYDNCLLELDKIFTLVDDYNGAREIQSFAKEAKRELQAQEDERKRKEKERQVQIKIQSLIDQAGLFMDRGKFKEAENLFPEIELLQPENSVVAGWRKRILEEGERAEADRKEKGRRARLNEEAQGRLREALSLATKRNYYDALDELDQVVEMSGIDPTLTAKSRSEIKRIEGLIATEREPLIEKGRQAEKEERLPEAYRAYYEASKVDPADQTAKEGMNRIKGALNSRAKSVYSEAVIAESFSDFDLAERKYREVMDIVPPENDYFVKASAKIKRLAALRKLGGEQSK